MYTNSYPDEDVDIPPLEFWRDFWPLDKRGIESKCDAIGWVLRGGFWGGLGCNGWNGQENYSQRNAHVLVRFSRHGSSVPPGVALKLSITFKSTAIFDGNDYRLLFNYSDRKKGNILAWNSWTIATLLRYWFETMRRRAALNNQSRQLQLWNHTWYANYATFSQWNAML